MAVRTACFLGSLPGKPWPPGVTLKITLLEQPYLRFSEATSIRLTRRTLASGGHAITMPWLPRPGQQTGCISLLTP